MDLFWKILPWFCWASWPCLHNDTEDNVGCAANWAEWRSWLMATSHRLGEAAAPGPAQLPQQDRIYTQHILTCSTPFFIGMLALFCDTFPILDILTSLKPMTIAKPQPCQGGLHSQCSQLLQNSWSTPFQKFQCYWFLAKCSCWAGISCYL